MIMFLAMILSGALSTMNVWVDTYTDMRFSLNDVYMIALMTGWMFLFMGLFDGERFIAIGGAIAVALSIWCIRTQFMITELQYIAGMIPHHSMAIHMSKKLSAHPNTISGLLTNIIKGQREEIRFMESV